MADTPIAVGVGALSVAGQAPTFAASALLVTGTITLPFFSFSAAMDQGVALPLMSLSATGLTGETTSVFQETLTLTPFTQAATILTGKTLDGNFDLPMMSLTANNGIPFDAALPLFDVAATILDGELVTHDVTLPMAALAATGLHTRSSVDLVLPISVLESTVLIGTVATGALTLPLLAETATAVSGVTATAALTLSLISADAEIAAAVSAIVELTLPRLSLNAELYSIYAATYRTYVMNVETDALTQYQSYGFNSFAKIGDSYYGASPNGIFELAGDDDNGVAIDASITLKNDNFGDSRMSRMIGAYLSADISDDMRFGVVVNGSTYQYEVPANGDRGLVSRRIDTVKGEKAIYWQVTLSNVGGADFSISAIEPLVKKLGRRI